MGLFSWIKNLFAPKKNIESSTAPSSSGNYVDLKNHGRVYFPAKGRFVQESHYANTAERFANGLFPSTSTEKIDIHLKNSFELLKKWMPDAVFEKVYSDRYKREWTPANDGSINEYGQAARGNLRPSPEEEIWQGNMNFKSMPAPGTKFLIAAPNGRKCVIQMGYEIGPGSAQFLGGVTTEVHYYLGTNSDSLLTIDVCDQSLPLGPYGVKISEPSRPTMPSGDPLDYTGGAPYAQNFVVGSDHKFIGVKYLPDPDMGDELKPKGVVVHFTCSYNLKDTAEYFASAGVDIHLLIDKNGEVVQMVPFNRKAAHAGESKWNGFTSLNNHFIGIELINIGPLVKKGEKFYDCYNREWKGQVVEREMLGYKYWEPFTAAQERALWDVLVAIKSKYKILNKNICGHHECSPGRKSDPGGSLSFTMESLRSYL